MTFEITGARVGAITPVAAAETLTGPESPREDLDRRVARDRCDSALLAHRSPDRLSLRPVPGPG